MSAYVQDGIAALQQSEAGAELAQALQQQAATLMLAQRIERQCSLSSAELEACVALAIRSHPCYCSLACHDGQQSCDFKSGSSPCCSAGECTCLYSLMHMIVILLPTASCQSILTCAMFSLATSLSACGAKYWSLQE